MPDDQPNTRPVPQPTPKQIRTLEAIRLAPAERASFSAELADNLHDTLNRELADTAALLVEKKADQWVSKRGLQAVNECEVRFLADAAARFEYSNATARGAVLHRGVEFWANSVHADDQAADFIGHAINFYIEQDKLGSNKLGQFLSEASPGALSALSSDCTSLLLTFWDTFPTIGHGWNLGVEVSRRHQLCDGAIVLSGKYDLMLGSPVIAHGVIGDTHSTSSDTRSTSSDTRSTSSDTHSTGGNTPGEVTAGRTIIDIKTGGRSPFDAEDARFYGVLETLVVGVPPMLVGTFYVTEGLAVTEKVDLAVLESSLLRTVAGIKRLVELHHGEAEPARRPGFSCSWCRVAEDCGPGQAWLVEHYD